MSKPVIATIAGLLRSARSDGAGHPRSIAAKTRPRGGERHAAEPPSTGFAGPPLTLRCLRRECGSAAWQVADHVSLVTDAAHRPLLVAKETWSPAISAAAARSPRARRRCVRHGRAGAGRSRAGRSVTGNQGLQRCDQRLKSLLNHLPDQIEPDLGIGMDEPVPHARDLSPGDGLAARRERPATACPQPRR